MIKQLSNLPLKEKTILLRTDYNVPLKNGRIDKHSAWRIIATFPTINYLCSKQAKIIIICHLGRPNGQIVDNLSVAPVARFLAKRLKRKLKIIRQPSFLPNELGAVASKAYFLPHHKKSQAETMEPGDILMLENLRFHPGEQAPDLNFAKALASIGEAYVNDAFATIHRKAASITLLPKLLPFAAGKLMETEIKTLTPLKTKPKRPLVLVMGGAKAKTKTKLIKSFLPKANDILIGGVLANTILSAQGIAIGSSVIDQKTADALNKVEITNPKLHLPVDVIVSSSLDGKKPVMIRPVGNIGKKENMILDIGPDTILLFQTIIARAKTIIWNGPMGYTETKKFSRGSKEILKAIIKNKKAYVVAGGGESITLISRHHAFNKIDFVSTGGGALLEFLAGEKLPGFEALKGKK